MNTLTCWQYHVLIAISRQPFHAPPNEFDRVDKRSPHDQYDLPVNELRARDHALNEDGHGDSQAAKRDEGVEVCCVEEDFHYLPQEELGHSQRLGSEETHALS